MLCFSTRLYKFKHNNILKPGGFMFIKNNNNNYYRFLSLKFFSLVCFSVILLFAGCNKDVNPLSARGENDFAIYLLQDQSLKFIDVKNKDISSLKLMSKPWLNSSDIEFYDFSSHCIYLKRDKTLLPQQAINKPFVVTANGKASYVGCFTSPASSYLPGVPSIDVSEASYFPGDILYIEKGYTSGADIRENEKIKSALISSGIYRGGIKVNLSDIVIINGDIASVKYTLTFTNNDLVNLFIIDPQQTGTGLFHYFTNGPSFYNKLTQKSNWSNLKTIVRPVPYNLIQFDWYTSLPAGKTISRTVTLTGYERFTPGDYSVNMIYANPPFIPKENRENRTGRYWLGFVPTSACEVTLK